MYGNELGGEEKKEVSSLLSPSKNREIWMEREDHQSEHVTQVGIALSASCQEEVFLSVQRLQTAAPPKANEGFKLPLDGASSHPMILLEIRFESVQNGYDLLFHDSN